MLPATWILRFELNSTILSKRIGNVFVKYDAVQCKNFARQVACKANEKIKWESVIGLEIHAQISSKSKLFSAAGTTFSGSLNTQVSFFDAALPGTLPVINRRCVEAALLTALALKCKVNRLSTFDRKHYFYADLPAGFQITQQIQPLAVNGTFNFVVTNVPKPYKCLSKVLQLQLEQDSGKSLHDEIQNRSLIDLNRAGIALMEIVFDCDLKNGEEAAALVEELQRTLRCLGTCNGKMEEGSLRVDANVSVNKPGEPNGVRTEIKNISSGRAIAKAIDFEIDRQIKLREAGISVINETRMFDSKTRETIPMRDKEMQQDYRFMPEPNLPPLILSEDEEAMLGTVNVTLIATQLPPLPDEIRNRIMNKYNLNILTAHRLICDTKLLSYFEEIMETNATRQPFQVANLLLQDLSECLNKHNIDNTDCVVTACKLGELLDLRTQNIITHKTKLEVLSLLLLGDKRTPLEIIEVNNWKQINNHSELQGICEAILLDNMSLVKDYQAGKTKVLKAILGLVRKTTENKANMAEVKNIILDMLTRKS